MITRTALMLIVMPVFVNCLFADINISPNPVWQADFGNIPTGVGWGDIDGDGWHDLVITNGCDYAFVSNHIYFNNDGTISTTPGWVSTDQQPSDNIVLADLDHDNDLDLVVAQLGYTPWGCPPLPHVVYYNNGGLSTSPDWYSQPGNSFSCAIGDPDGDGDHDIAFAQGDHLTGSLQRAVIYRNNDGVFDTLPYWESDSVYYGVEAAFVDIDMDGDHDLAIGGPNVHVALFSNNGGNLETTPSWQTQTIVGARQMDFGDVDGDGDQDLAVAGINGVFYLFENIGGTLDTLYSWSSADYNQPSCVAWADVDGDGDLDLSAGAWYSPVGIFENNNGTLSNSYVWAYGSGGFLQQIAWGDFDEDGLIATEQTFIGDGSRKLFYLSEKPIHAISAITINGAPASVDHYCYDLAQSWISFAMPLATGDTLTVAYIHSQDLDLAVTGNRAMIFENYNITGVMEGSVTPISNLSNTPSIIANTWPYLAGRTVKIYDITGRDVTANLLEPGIYFLMQEGRKSKKIIKVQ
jgi:hypothetical protein